MQLVINPVRYQPYTYFSKILSKQKEL